MIERKSLPTKAFIVFATAIQISLLAAVIIFADKIRAALAGWAGWGIAGVQSAICTRS